LIFWKWSFRWIFRRKPPYYKTLQDTEHSYQIIQGDLGLKLLLKLIKTKFCLFWYWNWTRCLACRVSRDFFLLWEGKGFYVPFPENQVEAKALAEKFMPFRKRKIEKIGQNLKYDLNCRIQHKCRRKIDTMIAHYLINPDMRHNMDILAETYLKYSQSLLKT
jgi:DNA polymerase-1